MEILKIEQHKITRKQGREIVTDNYLTIDRTDKNKNGDYCRLEKVFSDTKTPFQILHFHASADMKNVHLVKIEKYRNLRAAKNAFASAKNHYRKYN